MGMMTNNKNDKQMNLISNIELVIKTGCVFANCDGSFDKREEQFVKDFISTLVDERLIVPSLSAKLNSMTEQQYSFEDVISETNTLLNSMTEPDRKHIKALFVDFIEKLIKADDVIAPQETELFNRWKSLVA